MRDPEEAAEDQVADVRRSREEDALFEPETMNTAARANAEERSSEDPVRRVARLIVGLAPRPLLVPMHDLAEALQKPPPGPKPGEMHPLDRAFYEETISQRNRAWRRLSDLEHRVKDSPVTRIEKLLTRHGGGSLGIRYDATRREWSVMGLFGQEADDSPMAGGAVHGADESIDRALDRALKEANL